MKWEKIGDQGEVRAKVFGGWLVKSYDYKAHHSIMGDGSEIVRDHLDWHPSMAFVPDVNHEWGIKQDDLPECPTPPPPKILKDRF